jgi:HEAT repeat protein
MLSGLHDVDWASMRHAYGSAEEVPALLETLRSPNAEVRGEALSDFYNKVHHQGDVYRSTTASLPFLLELVGDPATPDRHEIVALLVSIGEVAVERCEFDYVDADFVGAAAFLREHAEAFIDLAGDAACRLRQAAIPGLGLFLADANRALNLLQDRSAMKFCLLERLLVTQTTATLAQRLPVITPAATRWLAGLAVDPAGEPEFRLAALIHRARCTPDAIDDDLVPAGIRLLREIADAASPEQPWPEPPPVSPPADGVPPFVAAAFEDLDRINRRYALTTDLLRTLHQLLGARVSQRTDLLVEQLGSPEPGVRLDAIRMTSDLLGSWRGDHDALIRLVAAQLGASNLEVAAEAATLLERHYVIAEPARESLAALLASHGPDGWATPQPHLRRLHQKAVMAIARLGDERALPSLLVALDSDVDAWLAVQVAGMLPQAADQLTPHLCDRLRRADLSEKWQPSASGILSALAKLGNLTPLPLITETLAAAAERKNWDVARSALEALRAFGPVAAPASPQIRSVAGVDDTWTRSAAVTTLWAVDGGLDEVMPLALALLDTYALRDAADVLGQIGPPAAAALPRLRELLTDGYEWNRVHAAAAIWDIGGESEAPVVLGILLQAWQKNSATGNYVAACLKRMGSAAIPALPQIRAELGRPERGGRFGSVDNDEELLRELAEVLLSIEVSGPAAPGGR